MTGDERSTLPAPGMVPAGRNKMTAASQPRGIRSSRPATALAAISRSPREASVHAGDGARSGPCGTRSAFWQVAVDAQLASQVEKFPEGTIVKIEFEGHDDPPDKIKPKLLSRVGQPLSHEKVEADLKTLLGTKWFSDVNY